MVHNKFRKDRIMKQRNVLTSAGGGGRRSTGKSSEIASNLAKCRTGSAGGFTMAEILLSLTIIGVVAAITLPSLTGNINERTWNTQRKALYARFSQAIALMPALNGYGTFTEDESGNITEDTAAETFVTSGLAKVLKINNICDNEHLEDCGITSKVLAINGDIAFSTFPKTLIEYNSMFGTSISTSTEHWAYFQTDTKAAAFETANGESIVVYYNPNCIADTLNINPHYSQPYMCASFVYDLNGTKGPNTIGKDMGFISAIYPSDTIVVAPVPVSNGRRSVNISSAGDACRSLDDDYRVPNREELMSMFYNRILIDSSTASIGNFYSSSFYNNRSQYWRVNFHSGNIYVSPSDMTRDVYCIKR